MSESFVPEFFSALETAYSHQVEWELPDLVGSPKSVVVGTLVRDRALTLINRDLVKADSKRRVKAPWGDQWAEDWWAEKVLARARQRENSSWWISYAPRTALQWAIVLDPKGAGEARWR